MVVLVLGYKLVIITCFLYIFCPIFHCGLYCRAVSVTDNLSTKQGNSSIFGAKSGFKSRLGYNGTRTVHYIEEARLLLLLLIEKCQEI